MHNSIVRGSKSQSFPAITDSQEWPRHKTSTYMVLSVLLLSDLWKNSGARNKITSEGNPTLLDRGQPHRDPFLALSRACLNRCMHDIKSSSSWFETSCSSEWSYETWIFEIKRRSSCQMGRPEQLNVRSNDRSRDS